jgi:hypothetical protein
MTDRHVKQSFTVRPPADVRDRLDARIAATGAKRNTFISDAIAEKLEREQQMSLVTEKVSENYQPRPGEMGTRSFWIAYPAHVSAYGHASDRIARATGRGETKKAALADAERQS